MDSNKILVVTDYDVLAKELPGDRFDIHEFSKHIGNSRFSVLVDMYREAFDTSHMRGKEEECDKIVDRIVGVTCHKDVDVIVTKGRFLARKKDDEDWYLLEEAKQMELVRQALKAPSSSIVEEEDELGEIARGVIDTGFSTMALNDKKRGRRKSLLRRSASESTMMEDKKKAYKALADLDEAQCDHEEPLDFKISPNQHRPPPMGLLRQHSAPALVNDPVLKYEGMDVVVAAHGRALSTQDNIVGNNRLQVMLTLENQRFLLLSPEEQDKVTAELLKTVVVHWNGRVLIEQGFGFRKLNDMEATQVLRALLLPHDSSIPVPVSSGTGAKPLSSVPQVPDFLTAAPLHLLAEDGNAIPGSGSIQSAAIKSLQQRKAKRALTKGLGQGRSVGSVPGFGV